MEISKKAFVREYARAIWDGTAAIFSGAGISRDSGFVNWKELLRPMAEEIKIDIEKEKDYLAVAQYYKDASRSRGAINQSIMDCFSNGVAENEKVEILARLPISTYWTTNYDELIEESLKRNNRKVDVKMDSDQLAMVKPDRDAVVYKMHGDVNHAAWAVLTKEDYMFYEKNRPLFRTLLKSDLLTKHFLFVGFSFNDPNIDFIMGQISTFLGENTGTHYWLTTKVQHEKDETEEDYLYNLRKQEMKSNELAYYGIKTVYTDTYEEVTGVLRNIEHAVKLNNVFISGSADCYGSWTKETAELLAEKISAELVKENFKVVSGFGLGIGSAVVNGALREIYASKYKHTDKYLSLRPFPQGIKDQKERETTFKKYRIDMISETGIAIFLFGNKRDPVNDSKIINANGCMEEYQIAKKNGDIIIPIGSTGYVAEEIWKEIKGDMLSYSYLDKYMDTLKREMKIDELVSVIMKIVKEQRS